MNDDDIRRAIHDALGEATHPASLVARIRAGASRLGSRRLPAANWVVAGVVAIALALVIGGTTIAVRGHRGSSGPPAIAGVPTTATPTATGTPSITAQASASVPATANPTGPQQQTPTSHPTATPRPSQSPPAPTSTPSSVPACSASDLSITAATDASSYAPATPIRITTSLRNVSSHSCSVVTGGCQPYVAVDDSAGNRVWSSQRPGSALCTAEMVTTLAAGQSTSFEATWQQCTWSGSNCTGQVPSGTYTARGVWPAGTSAPATFTII